MTIRPGQRSGQLAPLLPVQLILRRLPDGYGIVTRRESRHRVSKSDIPKVYISSLRPYTSYLRCWELAQLSLIQVRKMIMTL